MRDGRYDIWDPDRAIKDDEATGGNNRNEPRTAVTYEDANFQAQFDEMHQWNVKWQAKYPERGIPPSDSPEWDEYFQARANPPKVEGKIAIKAKF